MRRIMVLLTVVALMVVMLAMSVAPAFADKLKWRCTYTETGETFRTDAKYAHYLERTSGVHVCEKVHNQ